MTKPDSLLFLWPSSASLSLCSYPLFSILLMLVATWLLEPLIYLGYNALHFQSHLLAQGVS